MNKFADVVKALAIEFSHQLQLDVGTKNLLKIIIRNSKEPNKNICHSHDFCDANVCMSNACDWNKIDFTVEIDLVNAAWDMARANNFYIEV